MEHAKKMILVEPRVLEGMSRSQPVEDATNRDLKEATQTMDDILDSDAAAYDKANAYQQALWGFLNRFKQYKDRPLGKVQLTSDSKVDRASDDKRVSPVDDTTEEKESVVKDVLDSVPKSMRNKAERLLQRLKSNPAVKWNALGELEYGGRVIQQSNLTDLVNDVLRKRRQAPAPLGWEDFADALRQVNVAQDLIGNPTRWDYIRKTPALSTPQKTVQKKKSRRRRYEEVGDVDDDNDDDDNGWSTPRETSTLSTVKKRGRKVVNKKLTWSSLKK